MGKKTPHRLSGTLVALSRPLRLAERRALERGLRALLRWQRDLRGAFPIVRGAPDATPYVSLYANGVLRGCYGSDEGAPSERVARAFLLALGDSRYGGIRASERAELTCDVTYVTRARPVRADEIARVIEPGTHGVALVENGASTILLPSVAREKGHDAGTTLAVLAKKANVARSIEGIVWLLDSEEVSSRGVRAKEPSASAKLWLESLVDAHGVIAFDVDGATGALGHVGTMRHGRAAVVIEALAVLGSRSVNAARTWLAREIDRGLSRGTVGWPDRPDVVLGTLALAARAGVTTPLETIARSIDATSCSPWHAAQAASVLGASTPPKLWQACVRSLESHPVSPYALFAARLRRDAPTASRCTHAIVESIRARAPFEGGSSITNVPETALTAVSLEALRGSTFAGARRAAKSARAFILARQILDVPASLHPHTLGAFRASPIAPIFRCDVTAHAVLAIVS